ncbi:MAG: hypothetical protein QOD77_182 [Thermoplasmata archaeon]|jgi:rubrerythrin|nr:hypothetical protein [Thermoplasmata archaeon]
MTAARDALVHRLRLAYAGELAAARAYAGHWRSVRDKGQKVDIQRIMREELAHRARVGEMMRELGARPGKPRDLWMGTVGTAIAASCFVGGWYVPMYGAGRIERRNIWEYEVAARLALQAERADFADELLGMAEVEWDHEKFFHDLVRGHRWHRRFHSWPDPPPKGEIRTSFDAGRPPCTGPESMRPAAVAP